MKKVEITFEITQGKTEVLATGTTGNIQKTDITGTEIEKDFVSLMKKMRKYQQENQMLDSIDINKYLKLR